MALFTAYADEIETLIVAGAMAPGERLPSVRSASRRRQLSVSTVLRAYHLLEARGLIEARPRSGYYVRADAILGAGADNGPDRDRPTPVNRGESIFHLLNASRSRDLVPLGSAFPNPRLFPLSRLHRSLHRSMRHLDPHRMVEDLSPGNAALRRRIAVRYHLDGLTLDPDEIVITDGAMEALNLCLQTVTRPGDTVLVESPTFYATLQALERLDLRAVELPLNPDRGIDPAALDALVRRHRPAACWLMPTFQNPTGALTPTRQKRMLVRTLAAHGVPLIEDDVYGELHYGTQRPPPAKAFDRDGLVLHCGSFSKCLAPGYRIGWAVPGQFRNAVLRHKLAATLAAPIPSQAALADYLAGTDYDRHLTRLRAELRTRRDTMIDLVDRHFPPATEYTRPEGGYLLWLRLPNGTDARRLHRRALAAGISIAPGTLFSLRDEHADCIRLNYGHPTRRAMAAAMARLGELLTAG